MGATKELFGQMRAEEIANYVNDVENGELEALRAYAELKKYEGLISDAKRQLEPLAMDEAYNFGEKSFEHHGYKFEIRNGATRYNFKNISIWKDKQKELKEIEKNAKQAYLAIQSGNMIATGDGEEIELPEVTVSKDSLIVK